MRVLITGGAGFIGFHLASRLLALGEEVALLDNFNDFYDPRIKRRNVDDLGGRGRVALYEVDILDWDGLSRVMEAFRPEAIVHLAAWAGVRPSLERPRIYADVNVTGTVNMLETARLHEVGGFVFGSSSSVYGGNTKVPFSEGDSVARPVSPYAATKRAGELLCHTYSHNYGMNVTCLRFFTVYGPRQRPEMAIHKFAQLLWDGSELPIYGDGTTQRDYTYVDDIVEGIVAALSANPRYEILNLGESRTVPLLEVVSNLEAALEKKARLRFLPEQPGDMPVTYADICRARAVLGYDPTTDFELGIRKFAEWFIRTRR